jgi:hypothetical protein
MEGALSLGEVAVASLVLPHLQATLTCSSHGSTHAATCLLLAGFSVFRWAEHSKTMLQGIVLMALLEVSLLQI